VASTSTAAFLYSGDRRAYLCVSTLRYRKRRLVSLKSFTPIDPDDLTTVPKSVPGVLWYNVYGTNDAYVKMGGNPYDNADHTYVGSADDAVPNQAVMRYRADRNALASIEAHYQTTGRLKTPLVTLHNTLDPVVPYEHALLYGDKVTDAGASGLYTHIPVESYGHCNFNTVEIMGALNALLDLVQESGN